jgi:hypothetical protein
VTRAGDVTKGDDVKIHRTVFQVEVFSRGPFVPNGGDSDPFDLAEINYAITEGGCIGMVERVSSEIVPADKVEAEMLRIGNDGTFFDDDDDWLADA